MPYEGICNGETKGPRQVHEDATVHCPECEREMHVVKSFERTDGAFVSRHYRHNRRDGVGGSGGGGPSCGESDTHIKYKSIAASQLENIFAENCWKCEMEYRVHDTVSDADHRDADALLLFDERDEQLGQGIAAEVQYKNKTKDKRAVERDYIENDIATLWLEPDDFGDHRMRLSETDIRHRARETVWPTHVPPRSKWSTNTHRPRRLAFTNGDFNPHARDVSVPATLSEPMLETVSYRLHDWEDLFSEYAANRYLKPFRKEKQQPTHRLIGFYRRLTTLHLPKWLDDAGKAFVKPKMNTAFDGYALVDASDIQYSAFNPYMRNAPISKRSSFRISVLLAPTSLELPYDDDEGGKEENKTPDEKDTASKDELGSVNKLKQKRQRRKSGKEKLKGNKRYEGWDTDSTQDGFVRVYDKKSYQWVTVKIKDISNTGRI
jgi:hypothetical protein